MLKALVIGSIVSFSAASTAISQQPQMIPYASRAGQEVTVTAKRGIDTDHAEIETAHTPANATAFCRDYVMKVTKKCVREEMAVIPTFNTIQANCETGITSAFGNKFRFLGLMPPPNPDDLMSHKYRIIDLATGEDEDGSEASGYPTALTIFRALCPSRAPGDDE